MIAKLILSHTKIFQKVAFSFLRFSRSLFERLAWASSLGEVKRKRESQRETNSETPSHRGRLQRTLTGRSRSWFAFCDAPKSRQSCVRISSKVFATACENQSNLEQGFCRNFKGLRKPKQFGECVCRTERGNTVPRVLPVPNKTWHPVHYRQPSVRPQSRTQKWPPVTFGSSIVGEP